MTPIPFLTVSRIVAFFIVLFFGICRNHLVYVYIYSQSYRMRDGTCRGSGDNRFSMISRSTAHPILQMMTRKIRFYLCKSNALLHRNECIVTLLNPICVFSSMSFDTNTKFKHFNVITRLPTFFDFGLYILAI